MRSSRSGIGHGHDQRRASHQEVRRGHGGRRRVDDHRAQLDHRHRGYLGLRQVDPAAHDQPARRADPRTSPHRRPRHERGSPVPAAPPDRLRDPGARTLPSPHGPGEQYDRPAVLLTRPADPFVARMTGVSDRAMRLLSLTTAGEAALPGASEGPTVAASASLREVLSELLWRGAESAIVTDADGTPRGRLTVAAILARGRPS